MSDKITLPGIVSRLSELTGDTKRESEDFIKELFALVALALENGESVKIPSVGIFKTIEVEPRKSVNVNSGEETVIPGHRKVVFIPSKELAAKVNEPFEMFRTVELPDDKESPLDQLELSESDSESDPTKDNQPDVMQQSEVSGKTIETESVELPDPADVTESAHDDVLYEEKDLDLPRGENLMEETVVSESEPEHTTEPEPKSKQEHIIESVSETESEYVSDSDVVPVHEHRHRPNNSGKRRQSRFWSGFGIGFFSSCLMCGIAFVLVDGFCFHNIFNFSSSHQTVVMVANDSDPDSMVVPDEKVPTIGSESDSLFVAEKASEQVDNTVRDVPTEPSDQKVYDTITKTRYLTTMAKDHYGNYHLWPYIYKENAKFIGHPDRIRPGTRVVVPPLSKYGVNPDDPKAIEKAKKLGIEIYARFQ